MTKHGDVSRVTRAIGIGLTSATLVIGVATAVVAQSALDGVGAASAIPASTVAETATLTSARESESVAAVVAGANEATVAAPAALAGRSFKTEPASDRQDVSGTALAALGVFRVQFQEALTRTSTGSARPGWGCGDKNHTHEGPPGRPNATSPCK